MRRLAVRYWWAWILLAVLAGVVNDLLDRYAFGGSSQVGRDVLIGIVLALIALVIAAVVAGRSARGGA